ncbi:MAG: hypothetical protein HOP18_18445 [Deltaproteobacteria bacterium]|nr:hypothetical protein [Deltaproteobacteria bacterium]
MREAQRITCTNDGWFTMSFAAKADGYVTPGTNTIWRGQQQVIDLAYYPFPEGLAFQPGVSVDADARKSPPPSPSITFKMNGRTAFYAVTGTIWTWEVTFSSLGDPSGRPPLPDFPARIPLNILPYHL